MSAKCYLYMIAYFWFCYWMLSATVHCMHFLCISHTYFFLLFCNYSLLFYFESLQLRFIIIFYHYYYQVREMFLWVKTTEVLIAEQCYAYVPHPPHPTAVLEECKQYGNYCSLDTSQNLAHARLLLLQPHQCDPHGCSLLQWPLMNKR